MTKEVPGGGCDRSKVNGRALPLSSMASAASSVSLTAERLSFPGIVISHSGDQSSLTEAGDDRTGKLGEDLIAEFVHHAIGVKRGLHDLLIIDKTESPMKIESVFLFSSKTSVKTQ